MSQKRRKEKAKSFGTCKIPIDLVIATDIRMISELLNNLILLIKRMPEIELYLN